MIPVGEPYRASGPLDLRSVLTTVILGLVVAMVGALGVWAWEISPVPTLLFLTPCLQGLLVGAAFSFMVGRLRVRNPLLVGLIALLCGFGSAALVHEFHYLKFDHQTATQIRRSIVAAPDLSPDARAKALAEFDANPGLISDRALRDATGSSGFIGYMKMRNEQGITLKNAPVSGAFLWVIWVGEGLLVGMIAMGMAKGRAAQPYCEECGHWCVKEPGLVNVPAGQTPELLDAIRRDDPPAAIKVREQHLLGDPGDRAIVTLHACPGCDEAYADVARRIVKKKETKTQPLLPLHRVSPEMAGALRHGAAPTAEPEVRVGEGDEPEAELEPRIL